MCEKNRPAKKNKKGIKLNMELENGKSSLFLNELAYFSLCSYHLRLFHSPTEPKGSFFYLFSPLKAFSQNLIFDQYRKCSISVYKPSENPNFPSTIQYWPKFKMAIFRSHDLVAVSDDHVTIQSSDNC